MQKGASQRGGRLSRHSNASSLARVVEPTVLHPGVAKDDRVLLALPPDPPRAPLTCPGFTMLGKPCTCAPASNRQLGVGTRATSWRRQMGTWAHWVVMV